MTVSISPDRTYRPVRACGALVLELYPDAWERFSAARPDYAVLAEGQPDEMRHFLLGLHVYLGWWTP